MTKDLLFDVVTNDESNTERFGVLIAGILNEVDFVILKGDLGSGKTVFVRGAAERIIQTCHVTSPTYTVVNEYRGEGNHIFHYDLYRVTSRDDLETTGFYENLDKGIIFAEWGDNIPEEDLPSKYYIVTFEKISDNSRRITVTRIKKNGELPLD